MRAFVDIPLLALFVAMSGTVGVSGLVLVVSIQKEDTSAAWIWAGVFVMASLLAAWSFWRLA